jgi:hypothetical protein
MRQEIEQLN